MADLSVRPHGGTGDPFWINDSLGDLAFVPPGGAVLAYEARVYAEGTTTPILARQPLGPMTVDASGKCRTNVRRILNAQANGNYVVTIAAIGLGGTDESDPSPTYTVPLALP